MSLIGAFYYIRVVKLMYFDEPVKTLELADTCVLTRSVLLVNAILLLVIGVLPSTVMMYCTQLITG
jgi:NADH-quinone oxidoreductase subunit N